MSTLEATAAPATAPEVDEPKPALDEWRAALALGRIEGWRLLRSPAMLPGAAMLGLSSFGSPPFQSLRNLAIDSVFPCFMVAAMTIVAVNMAVRRSVRHGTEDLYQSAAVSTMARTGGHLLSLVWPAAATALILVAQMSYWASFRRGHGPFSVAELAVGPVIVLGAGALSLLLTRLWNSVLVAPLACVAIAALELYLTSAPALLTSGFRWLAFWPGGNDVLFPTRPALAHLVYLCGLTALAAVTALFVAHRSPRLVGLAAVALTVTLVAAFVQVDSLRPSAWAAVDRRLAAPEDGQVCRELHSVRHCAFPEDAGLIPLWDEAVYGVRRALPAGALAADLVVSERISSTALEYTNPDGRARLAKRLPHLDQLDHPVDDGRLHPSPNFVWERLSSLDLAAGAAALSVGLPIAPDPDGGLCDASGQGRAVIALWLAGQSTERARSHLERLAREAVVGSGPRRHVLFVDANLVYGGVAWGEGETALALTLLGRPLDLTTAAVQRDWARLTARSATTEDVAQALGVGAFAPPTAVPAQDNPVKALADDAAPRISAPCS